MSSRALVLGQSTRAESAVVGTSAKVARASKERDVRIDFLRGLFIISLCGSHFTWLATLAGYSSPLRYYDTQPFGFSSPAEFFVFFSGYILALVLVRSYERNGWLLSTARCVHRAWQLYVLNVFTMALVVATGAFLFERAPELAEASGIAALRREGIGKLFQYVTFRNEPAFFEILRNYILFIPLVPVALALLKRSTAALLVPSAGIWAAHLLGLTPDLGTRTFNPFAWQLVFFLGCYAGARRPLDAIEFPQRKRQIALFLLLIAGMFAIKLAHHVYSGGAEMPLTSKTDVAPLRLLHFGVMLWGALLIVPSNEVLRRFRIVDLAGAVGRNSLESFCFSNVLIYFAADLLSRLGATIPAYLGLQLLVVVLLMYGARTFEWFKSEPWRR